MVEYSIIDDECELKHNQTFEFVNNTNVDYNRDCGVCVLKNLSQNKSNAIIEHEIKSNNDYETYDILLFGCVGDKHNNFLSSLQWLSLHIVNDKNDSYVISIDNDKTKQFQNTLFYQDVFECAQYNSFGYIKWKHYLILFGGLVRGRHEGHGRAIHSIFYFDFVQMQWHESFKVL